MQLDLTDEEAAALLNVLTGMIEGGRYPMSGRMNTLRRIRARLPGFLPEPGVKAQSATPKENDSRRAPRAKRRTR
jgi:hypothetical protein